MKRIDLATLAMWLLVPLLETLSQIFMKLGGSHFTGMLIGWRWFIQVITSPVILLSFGCDVVSFLLWMHVLSKYKVGIAVPVSSLCYITIALAGWVGFNEPVTISEIIGTILIMSGVSLLAEKKD